MEKDLENLDKIINKLNDQLGIMGNNLIEKQFELDYLKQVNEKLNQINKRLIDKLNKPRNGLINFKN
uniref:Uncharacterized protein n=1 Tax=viral metagenome TaxID=1070528 RepID=A0A6C0D1K3_9ZZZZ